jgi:hypothetical protein
MIIMIMIQVLESDIAGNREEDLVPHTPLTIIWYLYVKLTKRSLSFGELCPSHNVPIMLGRNDETMSDFFYLYIMYHV